VRRPAVARQVIDQQTPNHSTVAISHSFAILFSHSINQSVLADSRAFIQRFTNEICREKGVNNAAVTTADGG